MGRDAVHLDAEDEAVLALLAAVLNRSSAAGHGSEVSVQERLSFAAALAEASADPINGQALALWVQNAF